MIAWNSELQEYTTCWCGAFQHVLLHLHKCTWHGKYRCFLIHKSKQFLLCQTTYICIAAYDTCRRTCWTKYVRISPWGHRSTRKLARRAPWSWAVVRNLWKGMRSPSHAILEQALNQSEATSRAPKGNTTKLCRQRLASTNKCCSSLVNQELFLEFDV